MASIDDGQVKLVLGEETYLLTPTITATKAIGRELGGLVQALAKVQALDFDAMHTIVKHGLQPDDRLAKRLPGMLFRGGMVRLIAPLTEYLMILSNGGQRPKPAQEEGDATEDGDDADDADDSDADAPGNQQQAAGA